MGGKILIVDDEESIRFTFSSFLEEAGYTVATAADYKGAVRLAEKTPMDLVFIDIILDGKTGIDLLRTIKTEHPNCQVIIITGAPSIQTASEALRLGALDYIVKPVRQETLLRAAGIAIRHKSLVDANEHYRLNMEAIFRSVKDGIISVDQDMQVVEMNASAGKLCRLAWSGAMKRTLPDLTHECSAGCLAVLTTTLRKKYPREAARIACRAAWRPDQTVGVSTSPLLDAHHQQIGCVMVLKDQTQLRRLEQSLRDHRQFDRIVGKSESIQKVCALIKNLANVTSSVLLTGESGTGKELVADAIHAMGDRSEKPLVKVNCAALTESLLESELFGHVRGAFTGAVQGHIGRFQRADGGTIFLDEIGDISRRMQLRFLRVLEQKEIERVGDATPLKVDVRVIAATNQNLHHKVMRGEFRKDLYYRLKVVEIKLPPLSARRDDIPLLISHFLTRFNHSLGKKIEGVSPAVRDAFIHHPWPGNIRELKNTLEHAFILCNRPVISVGDLPPDFACTGLADPREHLLDGRSERRAIQEAITRSGGNKSRAARMLGISRRTLYRKIHWHRIADLSNPTKSGES
jgi:DNA-binding NtrC family response regulator